MIEKSEVDKFLRTKLFLEYIVRDLRSKDDIKDEMNLKYDMGLDSLDLYELCMNIECEYNIQIPDHRFTQSILLDSTYKDLVDNVTTLINEVKYGN